MQQTNQEDLHHRVPTAQGKLLVRENREFGNFAKTHGIVYAQVVNSLILKIKDVCSEIASFVSTTQIDPDSVMSGLL